MKKQIVTEQIELLNLLVHAYYNEHDEEDVLNVDWYVNGVELIQVPKNSYRPYGVDNVENLKVGDEVFVLYVVYSDGDSFVTNCNNRFELLMMSKDDKYILENQQILEETNNYYGSKKHDRAVKLKTPKGVEYEYNLPWYDYFTSLSYVKVEKFVIEHGHSYLTM